MLLWSIRYDAICTNSHTLATLAIAWRARNRTAGRFWTDISAGVRASSNQPSISFMINSKQTIEIAKQVIGLLRNTRRGWVRSPSLTNKTLGIMLRAFFCPRKPDIENKLIRIIFERIELYAGALLALKNYLGRSSCQCMVKD